MKRGVLIIVSFFGAGLQSGCEQRLDARLSSTKGAETSTVAPVQPHPGSRTYPVFAQRPLPEDFTWRQGALTVESIELVGGLGTSLLGHDNAAGRRGVFPLTCQVRYQVVVAGQPRPYVQQIPHQVSLGLGQTVKLNPVKISMPARPQQLEASLNLNCGQGWQVLRDQRIVFHPPLQQPLHSCGSDVQHSFKSQGLCLGRRDLGIEQLSMHQASYCLLAAERCD